MLISQHGTELFSFEKYVSKYTVFSTLSSYLLCDLINDALLCPSAGGALLGCVVLRNNA